MDRRRNPVHPRSRLLFNSEVPFRTGFAYIGIPSEFSLELFYLTSISFKKRTLRNTESVGITSSSVRHFM